LEDFLRLLQFLISQYIGTFLFSIPFRLYFYENLLHHFFSLRQMCSFKNHPLAGFANVVFLVQVRWLILVLVVVLGAESFTLPPLPPLYPIIPPPLGFLPYFVAAKGTLVWASKYCILVSPSDGDFVIGPCRLQRPRTTARNRQQ
jgi:hypothetical protein